MYKECGTLSSTEEVKPFVKIKRSCSRDGDWEVRDETNEVFWILRFDPKFVFQIIDVNGNIIAKVDLFTKIKSLLNLKECIVK